MADKLCGLCFGNFSDLKHHLNVSHTIPNEHEFQLLLQYGNPRTRKTLDCKICGKKTLVCLDRHLQFSHNMGSVKDREPFMKEAKRAAIVKELAKLRESNPDVPLVSTLDMGSIAEHGTDHCAPSVSDHMTASSDPHESGLSPVPGSLNSSSPPFLFTLPICKEEFEEPLDKKVKDDEEEEMEWQSLDLHLSSSSSDTDGRNLSSIDCHHSASQHLKEAKDVPQSVMATGSDCTYEEVPENSL